LEDRDGEPKQGVNVGELTDEALAQIHVQKYYAGLEGDV